jgi:hypothetical protein
MPRPDFHRLDTQPYELQQKAPPLRAESPGPSPASVHTCIGLHQDLYGESHYVYVIFPLSQRS